MSGFDKKKSWSTGLPMCGLVDPQRAPDVITVEHEAPSGATTSTDLMKQTREDGSILYVGTPVSSGGKRCKFALTLETNGFFTGTAALNFIVQGGWGKGTVKPTREQLFEGRKNFVSKAISGAIILQGLDRWQELKSTLERDTGLSVSEGDITPEDRNLYALLGVKAFVVNLAASRGLRFEVDVPKAISRYVQPTYAKATEGEWDGESDEIALTSALTEAHVHLMKSAGLKFKRVRKARKGRQAAAQK